MNFGSCFTVVVPLWEVSCRFLLEGYSSDRSSTTPTFPKTIYKWFETRKQQWNSNKSRAICYFSKVENRHFHQHYFLAVYQFIIFKTSLPRTSSLNKVSITHQLTFAQKFPHKQIASHWGKIQHFLLKILHNFRICQMMLV